MKFVLLFVLAAVAIADDSVEVISDVRSGPEGPIYSHAIELGNGIKIQETGSEGSAGQAVAKGSFSFISPEGEDIQVSYTADELGFQALSNALPLDHPLPVHAQEQIAFAAKQRADGVEWDEQGFVI